MSLILILIFHQILINFEVENQPKIDQKIDPKSDVIFDLIFDRFLAGFGSQNGCPKGAQSHQKWLKNQVKKMMNTEGS